MERPTPASTLLDHIPEKDQASILRAMIASLPSGDHCATDFVASLLAKHPEQGVRQEFLDFLETAVRNGNVQTAVCIGLKFSDFGSELLHRAAEALTRAKSITDGKQQEGHSIHSYLLFIKSTISRLPVIDAHSIILQACLGFVVTGSKEVSVSSKDVVFAILSERDIELLNRVVLPCQLILWSCIQKLVASTTDSVHSLLGYSLWLRWILSVNKEFLESFISDEYWGLLIDGLRRGDSERRKICLNILKLTIAADSAAVSNGIHEQYYRYCTVFETIVLGRYINQIQECEDDLHFLATVSSVHPKWLYALLASALDYRMQDSNRKFVGNWVMLSGLPPSSDFMEFFQADFMPWAVQGRLFVATLRKKDGELHCVHGNRLSKFIKRLLETCSEPRRVTEIVIETIFQEPNALFAYATVYLLEGVKGTLANDQKKRIAELSRLPEVARDFVKLQIGESAPQEINRRLMSRREILEQQALAKCNAFNPEFDGLGPIWEDLEYLEHPKKLLMVISKLILHPILVQNALREPALASDLISKLDVLLTIAQTKTFLFPPLITNLRHAMAINSSVIEVFEVTEFIIRIVERPPEPTIDLMLEEATSYLTPFGYEHYFGERPSYGFAALLDLVSRIQESRDAVCQMLHRLLQPWKDQKVPPPTVSTWKTTLQLQIILLCFEQFTPDSDFQIQNLVDDLFRILAIEPLPRYRYLLEWIIVRLFIRHDLNDTLCERLTTKDHHSNPKYLASLMRIGTILACRDVSEEQFALRLTTTFVPLAASSKVVIRHEAQWQIPLLMDRARLQGWTSITENQAFATLDDYIRSMERFHDPPLERQSGRFDPTKDHTFTNLVEGSWFNLDQTEMPVTSRAEFVKLYEADMNLNLPASCMPLGESKDHIVMNGNIVKDTVVEDTANAVPLTPKTLDEAAALQTKGTAYLTRALSDSSPNETRKNDIIIVGSLVENPYNLGGLSRVSEIFGASALCLQNKNVISNKDFTSVSVSSHLHFPIVQLPALNICEYLAERKSEGFTVVGIEQTDRSVVLGSKGAQIPERVVLVVGSEKEGIPALVLTECDMLVEIPQYGITRSLNVQTAVSIVLYEHARQNKRTL